jgi:hypothetical protein
VVFAIIASSSDRLEAVEIPEMGGQDGYEVKALKKELGNTGKPGWTGCVVEQEGQLGHTLYYYYPIFWDSGKLVVHVSKEFQRLDQVHDFVTLFESGQGAVTFESSPMAVALLENDGFKNTASERIHCLEILLSR